MTTEELKKARLSWVKFESVNPHGGWARFVAKDKPNPESPWDGFATTAKRMICEAERIVPPEYRNRLTYQFKPEFPGSGSGMFWFMGWQYRPEEIGDEE